MRLRLVILVGALVLFSWSGPSFAQAESAGTVTRLKGEAQLTRAGKTVPLHAGDEVEEGDDVSTGQETRLEIYLNDKSSLTLGDGTSLVISEFVFDPDRRAGRASFKLLNGVMRMVSGEIARFRNENFVVRTPVASIGIRGTDFFGGFVDHKFRVVLISGTAIYVENDAGRVELTEKGSATTIEVPEIRPGQDMGVVLRGMPAGERKRRLTPSLPTVLPMDVLDDVIGRVTF